MKTQAEADAYLDSIDRWTDENGDVADPGPLHHEFYDFKETIDLKGYEAQFVSTNSDEALQGEPYYKQEDIEWFFRIGDFGTARLHLYCMNDVEMTGTWAEFWLSNEPWWNGHDPYECTLEQIAVLVHALPEEHLRRYVELASRRPGFVEGLVADGILTSTTPSPKQ